MARIREFDGELDELDEPRIVEFTGELDEEPGALDSLYRKANRIFGRGSVMDEADGRPGRQDPVAKALAERIGREYAAERAPTVSQSNVRMVEGPAGMGEVALRRGVGGIIESLGGAARGVGDAYNIDALARGGADLAESGTRFAGRAQLREGHVPGFGPESVVHELPQAAANAGASILQTAPSLLANVFLPGSGLPLLFAQTGAQEYGQGREAGLNPAGAVLRAIPQAGAEVLGEKVGGFDALSKGIREAITDNAVEQLGRDLVKYGIRELPGEELTTTLQFSTDKAPGIGINQEATLADYAKAVKDTALATLLQSGAMTGGGAVLERAAKAGDAGNNPISGLYGKPQQEEPGQEAGRDISELADAIAKTANIPSANIVEAPDDIELDPVPGEGAGQEQGQMQAQTPVPPPAADPDAKTGTNFEKLLPEKNQAESVPENIEAQNLPEPDAADSVPPEPEKPRPAYQVPLLLSQNAMQVDTPTEGLRPGDVIGIDGKPFATKAKAGKAKKDAGRGWAVKRANGGFVVRYQPQTDAQKAALKNRMKKQASIDTDRDSMFAAIAKLGGINAAEVKSEWGFDDDLRGLRGAGIKRVATANGHSIDSMGEMLAEQGYLSVDEHGKYDRHEFEDLFGGELAGSAHYTPEGFEHLAERMQREKQEEAAERNFEDGLSEQDIADSGFDDLPDGMKDAAEGFLADHEETEDELEDRLEREAIAAEAEEFERSRGPGGRLEQAAGRTEPDTGRKGAGDSNAREAVARAPTEPGEDAAEHEGIAAEDVDREPPPAPDTSRAARPPSTPQPLPEEDSADSGAPFSASESKNAATEKADAVRAAIADDIYNHEVDVYATLAEAPDYVQEQARRERVTPEGFFDPITNRVAIIASEVTAKRAVEVARHELIGHFGLENMLGPDEMRRQARRVIKAEAEGNKAIIELARHVDLTQPNLSPERRAKEIIAVMAERNMQNSIVRRVMDAIRKFLKAIGFTKGDITDAQIAALLRDTQAYLREQGREMVAGEPAPAAFSPVYHGTPHVWPPEPGFPHGRPRLDKIGSGESGAAYGWGWYSAENPGVADSYALGTSGTTGPVNVAYRVMAAGNDPAQRLKQVYPNMESREIEEAIAKAKEIKGNLYRLDIPDAVMPYLLDWDKRLSAQTPEVQKALEKLSDKMIDAWRSNGSWPHITGETLYRHLADGLTVAAGREGKHKAASEKLASLGIVGNRYLDQLSRGRKDGTYNFVIWHQPTLDKVALLSRNGEKLDAIREAEFSAGLFDQEPTALESGRPLTRAEVLEKQAKEEKLAKEAAKPEKKKETGRQLQGDQVDLFNTQSSLFSGRAPETLDTLKKNLIEAKKKFKAAKGSPVKELFELSKTIRDARDRLAAEIESLPDDGFTLQGATFQGKMQLLTQSAQQPGKWQLTRFDDKGEPWGDTQYTTKRKAIDDFLQEVEPDSVTENPETLFSGKAPARQKQTDTPEFKRWFGDSKITDKDGKPKVVYHGTASDFSIFAKARVGASTGAKSAKAGFWFVDDSETASNYADLASDETVRKLQSDIEKAERRGDWDTVDRLTEKMEEHGLAREKGQNIIPVFLKMRKPFIFEAGGESFMDLQEEINRSIKTAKEGGHDGIIFTDLADDPNGIKRAATHYLVFEPGQAKSATGNRGTFDPENPDILFSSKETPPPKAQEIHATNAKVNRQIEQWAKGKLNRKAILQLGQPSEILRLFNMPNLPIYLTQYTLSKGRKRHAVSAADLKDIALNVQTPIAVFKSTHGEGHIVLITEARHAEGNITVAMDLDIRPKNININVNDIATIYPREDSGGLIWVEKELLLGYERHKGRDWLRNMGASNSLRPQAKATLENAIVYSTDHIRNPPDILFSGKAPDRQTDTPAFKRWFGKSQVVDENGEPLRVYHGTRRSFNVFDEEFQGENAQSTDIGFFFTDSPAEASAYTDPNNFLDGPESGGNVMPVYLSMQNPQIIEIGEEEPAAWYDANGAEEAEKAINAGHDGLIVRSDDVWMGEEKPHSLYVAFHPEQIKSATGNRGTFDPDNPDIRFSGKEPEPHPQQNLELEIDPITGKDFFKTERDTAGRRRYVAGRKIYDGIARRAVAVLDKVKLADNAPENFKAMMRAYRVDMAKAQANAEQVAKIGLEKLTAAERKMLSDVIEGNLAPTDLPPETVLRIATEIQAALRQQGQDLVELGMLTEDRLIEQYLPRVYRNPLLARFTNKAIFLSWYQKARMRISGARLKSRGLVHEIRPSEWQQYRSIGWKLSSMADGSEIPADLREAMMKGTKLPPHYPANVKFLVWRDFTRDEREQMGEIHDGLLRYALGYVETQRDIAIGRLFKAVASDQSLASKINPGGWAKVPDEMIIGADGVKRFGALSGMYVPEMVRDMIERSTQAKGPLMQVYDRAMNFWREGKTVWNPVAHGNNFISNIFTAHFAGVNPADPRNWRKTIREYRTKGAYYQEAINNGLFGTEWASKDIQDLFLPELVGGELTIENISASRFNKVMNFLKRTGKPIVWYRDRMQRAYEFEDQFFKLMLFIDRREAGASIPKAIEDTERYIFNYADVPEGVETLKRTYSPFIAYTYKALPMLIHTALTRPDRLLAPMFLLGGANWLAYALMGGDEDDERKNMPEYLKGRTAIGTPKAIRMPFNVEDKPAYMDMTRRVPLGDLFDMNNQAGGLAAPAPMMPSHPLFTAAAALFFNKDTFTGKDLTKASDTDWEVAQKRADWIYKQIIPNAPFIPGSWNFDKLMNGAAYAFDTDMAGYTGYTKAGDAIPLGLVLLDVAGGTKIRASDPARNRDFREYELSRERKEIMSNIRSAQRNRAMTPDKRESYIERQREKMQELTRKQRELN